MYYLRKTFSEITALLVSSRIFIMYIIIGGCALLVEMTTYIALNALGARIELSNAAGMSGGMLTSFALNCRYNFRVRDRLGRRFLSFMAVTLISYLLSTLLLLVLVRQLDFDSIVAKAITLPIVLLLQFSVNKRVTFNSTPPQTTIPS